MVFLLKPIPLEPIDLVTKERLIQSGARHYSELLSPEAPPSPRYLEAFHQAFALNRRRMARDLLDLAAIIGRERPGEITLVSLARAGTPIGVAVKHILERFLDRPAAHYSLSIIRDRGLDPNALEFLLDRAGRAPESLLFLDGWTGKGVIARELARALADFNARRGLALDPRLFVLSDLAGVGVAPGDEDYLIPSSLLNATLSGLVSRSILNHRIGPGDFHGCVYYREFAPEDLSVWFIEAILADAADLLREGHRPNPRPVDGRLARQRSREGLARIMARHGLRDPNLIKPGIGEATRVLLRRLPERVLVRDAGAPEVAHLLRLAEEKRVPWEVDDDLPYAALSLIKVLAHV